MEHCKFSKKVNDPHYFPHPIHHPFIFRLGYDKATYGWNLLDYVIAPFPIWNKCKRMDDTQAVPRFG
jgi:hypothetical protein